jgi:hypothetical protein
MIAETANSIQETFREFITTRTKVRQHYAVAVVRLFEILGH